MQIKKMRIMHTYKCVFYTLLLVCCGAELSAQTQKAPVIDKEEAALVARQLVDTTLLIGVFEVPDFTTNPRYLKNGVLPEIEEGYLEVIIKSGVQKLNLEQSIRGNFDSMAFVKAPEFQTHNEFPLRFLPFTATRWLLFMRSGYDSEGKPSQDWLKSIDQPKYINRETAFEVTDNYQGIFCMGWNKEFEKPQELQLYSAEFIKDISSMTQLLKTLPALKTDPQYTAKLNKMMAQLQDPSGKIVGEQLRTILLKN
jgi:hypothetical protein